MVYLMRWQTVQGSTREQMGVQTESEEICHEDRQCNGMSIGALDSVFGPSLMPLPLPSNTQVEKS